MALLLLLAVLALQLLTDVECVVPGPLRLLGGLVLAAGIFLIGWAGRTFAVRGTTHDTRKVPTALVTTGPYAFSRNPMYLGLTAILIGIGLGVGTIPFLAVTPLFVVLIRTFYVPLEEAALERAFGPAYHDYAAHVRRWL